MTLPDQSDTIDCEPVGAGFNRLLILVTNSRPDRNKLDDLGIAGTFNSTLPGLR